MLASRAVPHECVFVMVIGPSQRPASSTQMVPVSSPLPLSVWQPYYVKDRNSYPADLHRRVVASKDKVFVTLSIHGPVSALDAITGEILRTYDGTDKTEGIIHEDGIADVVTTPAEIRTAVEGRLIELMVRIHVRNCFVNWVHEDGVHSYIGPKAQQFA